MALQTDSVGRFDTILGIAEGRAKSHVCRSVLIVILALAFTAPTSDVFAQKTAHVNGYTKKDGTRRRMI